MDNCVFLASLLLALLSFFERGRESRGEKDDM